MKKFKLFGGKFIDDYIQYSVDYIRKHPDVNIHVGTDSDDKANSTQHATTICFEHPRKGVHVIFKLETHHRYRLEELNLKILKETELSLEVADKLSIAFENVGIEKQISIHCDVNPSDLHGSNCAYSTTTGWVVGSGYKVFAKPEAWAASSAADLLCK